MQVAPLRYDVIFKKAFGDIEVFKAFVKDFLDIELNIKQVETEKKFTPAIGNVDSRFDLYAEDIENRVIVDIQHRRYDDHYARFLHYHCAAILEQISTAKNYLPALTVFTIVVSTTGSQEDVAIAEINFDPVELFSRQRLYKIPHRLLYLSPKYWTPALPEPYQQWLRLIQDSLDEHVDEAIYHKPEIIKALNLIKTDGLTPQDRARLKDEYSLEQALKQEKLLEFKKGVELGIEQGLEQGIEQGKLEGKQEIARKLESQGMTVALVEQLTGLSHEQWK